MPFHLYQDDLKSFKRAQSKEAKQFNNVRITIVFSNFVYPCALHLREKVGKRGMNEEKTELCCMSPAA